MRVCSERTKERADPRHTILPLPPHYHVRGEMAVLVSGRKRAFAALDETIAYSSFSGCSASTDSSRPPRPRRLTFLGLEDGGVSAIHTSRGGPAMPTTGGDRGGGFAPAHRRNLEPAHNNYQTLSKAIAAARQRNASGGNTAGSRPTVPTQEGESWGMDLHLRQATTLIPRSAITIRNPRLTDTLRWIASL
jgi:hypothetical protein